MKVTDEMVTAAINTAPEFRERIGYVGRMCAALEAALAVMPKVVPAGYDPETDDPRRGRLNPDTLYLNTIQSIKRDQAETAAGFARQKMELQRRIAREEIDLALSAVVLVGESGYWDKLADARAERDKTNETRTSAIERRRIAREEIDLLVDAMSRAQNFPPCFALRGELRESRIIRDKNK